MEKQAGTWREERGASGKRYESVCVQAWKEKKTRREPCRVERDKKREMDEGRRGKRISGNSVEGRERREKKNNVEEERGDEGWDERHTWLRGKRRTRKREKK